MADQTCNPAIITQALGIQATGPRTVIVPADPIIWDAETSYEYLTLVASTDFGQAYISKRDVPSGTPLTDTEYWIPAASYNAQLAAIQANVSSLSTDVNEIQQKVDMGLLTGGIAVGFGDSNMRGYGLSSPNTMNWAYLLAQKMGWTLYNFGTDGSGFGDGSINEQVSTASADASFNNDDVKIVLVSGGINDHGRNKSIITNGINTFLSNVSTTFPNAFIFVLPCLCASLPLDQINQGDDQLEHAYACMYVNQALSSSPVKVTTVPDAFRFLTGMAGVNQDAVHPNQSGHVIIANRAYSVLMGGSAFPVSIQKYQIEPNTTFEGKCTAFNGICYSDGYMWEAKIHFLLKAGQSLGIGDSICSLPSPLCDGTSETDVNIETFYLTNNTDQAMTAFRDGKSIKMYTAVSSTEASDYYINVKGIVGLT